MSIQEEANYNIDIKKHVSIKKRIRQIYHHLK